MSQQLSTSDQPSTGGGADVVSLLKAQHEQIKKLFGTVLNAKGPAKAAAYAELKNLMSAHEAGEEAVVHPVAEKILARGDVIVRERLHEENKAKRAIAMIDALNIETSEFDDQLRALQADVLEHAEAEEREEFDALAGKLDPAQLQRMRTDLEAVENTRLRA